MLYIGTTEVYCAKEKRDGSARWGNGILNKQQNQGIVAEPQNNSKNLAVVAGHFDFRLAFFFKAGFEIKI